MLLILLPVTKIAGRIPGMFYWFNRWANVLLRRLLRVGLPVPAVTDAEVAATVARNYRWNFTVNLLDGATFWFGINLISSATIVPLFISKLTDNPLPLGLVAMIAQGSWFLPQLFTANVVERLARKKPVVVNLGFFSERLPMVLLVLAAVVAGRRPILALWLFLFGYVCHGLGAGIVATAWQDLIARTFPVERRGRFFGTTMFVGAAMGVLGAGLSTYILQQFTFPNNFILLFAIAAAALFVSWGFLALTREPVQPVTAVRQSERQFWASLPEILRRDRNFRRYLAGRLLLSLGGMGTGFVAVTAVARWDVPDSAAGLYTGALLVGQTAGNLLFGFLADKYGHKLSLELAALTSALAFGLAWLAPGPNWYLLVFALLGVSLGAIIVSGILVVMEFSPPERRPTYVGLANTAVGVVSVMAPLLGTWLVGFSYAWLFGLSAAVNLLALAVMRWAVQEPRFAAVSVEELTREI